MKTSDNETKDSRLSDTARRRVEDLIPAQDPITGEYRDPVLKLRDIGVSPQEFSDRLKQRYLRAEKRLGGLPWWVLMLLGALFLFAGGFVGAFIWGLATS